MDQIESKQVVDIQVQKQIEENKKEFKFCIKSCQVINKGEFLFFDDPKFYWITALEKEFSESQIPQVLRNLKISLPRMRKYCEYKLAIFEEYWKGHYDVDQERAQSPQKTKKKVIKEQQIIVLNNIPQRMQKLVCQTEQKCLSNPTKSGLYLDQLLNDVKKIQASTQTSFNQ